MTTEQSEINHALNLISEAHSILNRLLKLDLKAIEPQLTAEEYTSNKLLISVKEVFGVNPMTKGRKKEIVLARHAYRYLLRKHTSWVLDKIGLLTGTNDHKTVIHSISVVKDLMETDPNFANLITKCQESL